MLSWDLQPKILGLDRLLPELWNILLSFLSPAFYFNSCTAWKVSKYGVFLVRIFPHSDWIRRDTSYSVLSPNAGKYGPEKTPYFDTFHTVVITIVVFIANSVIVYFILACNHRFSREKRNSTTFFWMAFGLLSFPENDLSMKLPKIV